MPRPKSRQSSFLPKFSASSETANSGETGAPLSPLETDDAPASIGGSGVYMPGLRTWQAFSSGDCWIFAVSSRGAGRFAEFLARYARRTVKRD